jgi:hypothetical protein
MDGTDPNLCSITGFVISGVDPSSYAAAVLDKSVRIMYEFQFHKTGLSVITVKSH